jgi:nicotinate-nucleotide adenylyltransferase
VRIGLFGGSFDPPHNGHLLVAQDAIEALALDHLLVIPAAQQPLKDQSQTPAEHRLAMVQACFDGVPQVQVDPVEITRGGLSFMVDTVEDVQRRWPSARLHLLIGSDVVPTLPRWKEPERLLGMVRLVVLYRDTTDTPSVDREIHGGGSAEWLATRRVDVSSTEIRTRVRNGRSIKGFVPDAVATYIASTGLYLDKSRTADRAEV